MFLVVTASPALAAPAMLAASPSISPRDVLCLPPRSSTPSLPSPTLPVAFAKVKISPRSMNCTPAAPQARSDLPCLPARTAPRPLRCPRSVIPLLCAVVNVTASLARETASSLTVAVADAVTPTLRKVVTAPSLSLTLSTKLLAAVPVVKALLSADEDEKRFPRPSQIFLSSGLHGKQFAFALAC